MAKWSVIRIWPDKDRAQLRAVETRGVKKGLCRKLPTEGWKL